jgi:hypothetical protein
VFDVYVNGVKKLENYDILAHTGGVRFKATVELIQNISSSGTIITFAFVPEPGSGAAINGIDIVKP